MYGGTGGFYKQVTPKGVRERQTAEGEGAIRLLVEAGGEGFEGVGEEVVVLGIGVGDCEAGFQGGERGEHKRSDGVAEFWSGLER